MQGQYKTDTHSLTIICPLCSYMCIHYTHVFVICNGRLVRVLFIARQTYNCTYCISVCTISLAAICNPPCLNDGACTNNRTCQCIQYYSGPQCEGQLSEYGLLDPTCHTVCSWPVMIDSGTLAAPCFNTVYYTI